MCESINNLAPSRFRVPNNAACLTTAEGGWPRCQLTVHGLGDDQAEVMVEPVFQAPTPMFKRVSVAEHRLDPDLATGADLDETSRHVVGPKIECAATRQIEARVMPVAGQGAFLDTAAFEREAHMGASVVKGQRRARRHV
jgi:hypothetical protein